MVSRYRRAATVTTEAELMDLRATAYLSCKLKVLVVAAVVMIDVGRCCLHVYICGKTWVGMRSTLTLRYGHDIGTANSSLLHSSTTHRLHGSTASEHLATKRQCYSCRTLCFLRKPKRLPLSPKEAERDDGNTHHLEKSDTYTNHKVCPECGSMA